MGLDNGKPVYLCGRELERGVRIDIPGGASTLRTHFNVVFIFYSGGRGDPNEGFIPIPEGAREVTFYDYGTPVFK